MEPLQAWAKALDKKLTIVIALGIWMSVLVLPAFIGWVHWDFHLLLRFFRSDRM